MPTRVGAFTTPPGTTDRQCSLSQVSKSVIPAAAVSDIRPPSLIAQSRSDSVGGWGIAHKGRYLERFVKEGLDLGGCVADMSSTQLSAAETLFAEGSSELFAKVGVVDAETRDLVAGCVQALAQ